MWPAIFNVLRLAAYGSVGYFVNDVGDAVQQMFFQKDPATVKKTSGEFKWWYIFLILIALGAVISLILYLIQSLFPSKKSRK